MADEGLARITDLRDRNLVAQAKKTKTKSKEPHYSAVETEDPSSEPFQGPSVPALNNFFFGIGSGFFDGFGMQARYSSRVIERVLPDLNNSLNIEGGLTITFYGTREGQSGVLGVGGLAVARWDFQMDKNFIFFGDVGLGVSGISNNMKDHVRGGGLFPAIGIGAMYNFTNEYALRADLSYQFTGVGFVFRF